MPFWIPLIAIGGSFRGIAGLVARRIVADRAAANLRNVIVAVISHAGANARARAGGISVSVIGIRLAPELRGRGAVRRRGRTRALGDTPNQPIYSVVAVCRRMGECRIRRILVEVSHDVPIVPARALRRRSAARRVVAPVVIIYQAGVGGGIGRCELNDHRLQAVVIGVCLQGLGAACPHAPVGELL